MAVARRSGQIAAAAPVIVDTGLLIALARAGHLGLLRNLFGQIHVTPVVRGQGTRLG